MAVRHAAVAGRFYPDHPARLREAVGSYLAAAGSPAGPVPKAVIAPHAGYVFSGPVAAHAYARLAPARGSIRRVVLMGPSHRVAFRGIAVPASTAFETPLGTVPVDVEAVRTALSLPGVGVLDAAHAAEHSLEVHLPFLQEVLGAFSLVPLVAGDADPPTVARVLETLWDGPETLVVISSDLSHYLDYDSARRIDAATVRAIEQLDETALGQDQACGRVPISGLLALARRRGMRVETLDVRNSGDTAGPRDAVVGYGAWAFHESPGRARRETEAEAEEIRRHAADITGLARESIRHGLNGGGPVTVDLGGAPALLRRAGASFVTIKKNGDLRGCMGSPRAHRPLAIDVAENAYRSAFQDPRFPPLGRDEAIKAKFSVAVLTPPRPLPFTDEADLLGELRPGIDGLIIAEGNRRALFLPAVWQSLPDPEAFLAHLKHKAGLDPRRPSAALKAERFESIDLDGGSLLPMGEETEATA